METVKSIEKQLIDINKGLPKLPKGLTKWLAEYAWLLVLIGVVVTILSLSALIPLVLAALGLTTFIGAQYGLGSTGLYDQLGWLNIILSLASLVIVLYLEAIAISPLKDKKYRGWQLIFIANLVSLALGIVSSLITLQFASIIWSLVFAAIGFYVLFQVRDHFVAHAPAGAHKKPAFKEAKPAAK